jgi:hypothetical protein
MSLPRRPLAALAVAALASAALAASGSAKSSPPTTLHLVAKAQRGVGFFPSGRPKQGARLGFGHRVSGDDTGIDRGVCTIIGRQVLCTVQLQLAHGTLSGQGIVPQVSHDTPVAITGGTGAYDGARGTARVTDLNPRTSTIDITLLP